MINILIIGSGGREHAIIKKLNKSNHDTQLYCLGTNNNPGITKIVKEYNQFAITTLITYCRKWNITFAIIGPEKYLHIGITDLLLDHNIPCVSPTKDYAQIETSKCFARELLKDMKESVTFRSFDSESDMNDIIDFIKSLNCNYVIKDDGLRGGKGVKVSDIHLNSIDEAIVYCEGLDKFLVEEKLEGDEFSLMSFVDGKTLKHMPPVMDYKQLYKYGPNTGSMGAITLSNHLLSFLDNNDLKIAQITNEKVIELLNNKYGENGYRGILYGSYMKTYDGDVRIIEYNARFGDPECINIMSILNTDLVDICMAIIDTSLDTLDIKYDNKCSISKYLVPIGYPDNPNGDNQVYYDVNCDNIMTAGVYERNNKLYQNKSRNICVIDTDYSLQKALNNVNDMISNIQGPFYHREDVGKYIVNNYKDAGVDIAEGDRFVNEIKKFLPNIGGFGGIVKLNDELSMVSSTDSVGTKTIIAEIVGKYYNLGHDIVNHCVNDILVQGAQPSFFLDYLGLKQLDSDKMIDVVRGIYDACKNNNCVLAGGETAELYDMYQNGTFDLVGAIAGTVENDKIIDGKKNIQHGDVVIGLPSSGLHTNGYTLVRKLFSEDEIREMGDILLAPHMSYLNIINRLIEYDVKINGLVHVTGGGMIENPIRVLRKDLCMVVKKWDFPEIYKKIQKRGNLSDREMHRTLNCGIGMLIITDKDNGEKIINMVGNAIDMGVVVNGNREVIIL